MLPRSPYWKGSLYYVLFWGAIGAFAPFVNVRWTQFGITVTQLSVLSIFGPICTLLLAPIVSRLADRYDRHREWLALGLGGMACSIAAGVFVKDFWGAFFITIAFVIAQSPVGPLGDGLIARMASTQRLNYGSMRMWGSLSFALVSLLGGVLWQRFGYTPMFLLSGLGLALAAPAALGLMANQEQPSHDTTPRHTPQRARDTAPMRPDAALITVMVATLLIGLGLGLVGPFFGVRLNQLGAGPGLIGLFYAIAASAELPVMQLEARIAKRLSDAGTLLLAGALYVVSHVVYASATSPHHMLAAAALQGTSFGFFFVGTVRIVDARAGALIGTLQSWRNALLGGIAPLVAAPITGVLSGAYGIASVFWCCSAVMLVATLVIWFGRRGLGWGRTKQ